MVVVNVSKTTPMEDYRLNQWFSAGVASGPTLMKYDKPQPRYKYFFKV